MTSSYLLLLLACVLFICTAAQKSCTGRCGEAYYRGNPCQCDYDCLSHKECCKNFESVCTTRDSCKGRCGEPFKRGRQCHCDIECVKFGQCCADYETQCTLEDYDPEDEELATGSEPLPTDAPENKAIDPIEPTLLPTLPEADTETNEEVKEASGQAETEESSSHLPEEQSATVPSTTISSSLPQTTQAPTETTDLKDPPVPDEDSESPQNASESEHLSPTSSAPTLPPEMFSTEPKTTQQPSDQPPVPTSPAQAAVLDTTPASEQPDQNAQTNEPNETNESTPPTTASPSSLDIDPSNSTELKPTVPDQTEGTPAPENETEPQTEQPQSEPSENATSEGEKPHDLDPTEPSTAETTKPQEDIKDSLPTEEAFATPASEKVDPSPTKEPEKPTKPKVLDEGSSRDYQADANNDTNLCSGRPVNGATTLRNGTIVVFRGHYFWTLDSKRKPGPPLGITDVWGIPSPIDTVYTRCNCQGKTYFFKGENYWRFENGIMDSGFPRPISAGFGLSGQITAALSMPQYRSRKESVFFFKRGGLAQRYSYRMTPQCGKNVAVYTTLKKVKRQAEPELGQEIDIRKTWRGFPSTVTSAVSVPSPGGDGYKYYIFSRTKYYNLKMEGNTPVILTPRDGPGKQKSAKSWFRCPET